MAEVSTRITAVQKHLEKLERDLCSLRKDHEALETSTAVEISSVNGNLEECKRMQEENHQKVFQAIEKMLLPTARLRMP